MVFIFLCLDHVVWWFMVLNIPRPINSLNEEKKYLERFPKLKQT